jgi:hypothetical protein
MPLMRRGVVSVKVWQSTVNLASRELQLGGLCVEIAAPGWILAVLDANILRGYPNCGLVRKIRFGDLFDELSQSCRREVE